MTESDHPSTNAASPDPARLQRRQIRFMRRIGFVAAILAGLTFTAVDPGLVGVTCRGALETFGSVMGWRAQDQPKPLILGANPSAPPA